MYKLPINLHRNNFCKQLRYYLHNNINTIRQCNHMSNNKEQNALPNIYSVQFPTYKVVYQFSYVKHAIFLNKLKLNCTFLTGVFIPIIITIQLLGFMSTTDNILLTSFNCLATLSLHTISYFSNNVIGSIYYKEDKESVIISYVNYWGNRVDRETTVGDIILYSENNVEAPTRIYKKVHIVSCKDNLKLYTNYGKINTSIFPTLFQNIE
ncbi:unnamed protein product [Xylocopa violacea]|uniref:Transmembrane protein 186 n=1 Tax=Xylocopa violacea TaxID=135666 RepID=A0ABP1MYV0_XYLVO